MHTVTLSGSLVESAIIDNLKHEREKSQIKGKVPEVRKYYTRALC